MTTKKDASKEVDNQKPANAPEPTEEAVVSDEQLDQVSGGLNPQPLPPRILSPNIVSQISKILQR